MRSAGFGCKCCFTCMPMLGFILQLVLKINFSENTTLRILTSFFAYTRDKSEELSVYTLADALTYPEYVLNLLHAGGSGPYSIIFRV